MSDKVNYDLGRLTDAETLYLIRKSRHETQRRAAKRLGVSLTAYTDAELSPLPIDDERIKPTTEAPRSQPLLLRLARRRSNWLLRDIAEGAGMSHVSFLVLESQGDQRIVDYWRSQGFSFPKAMTQQPTRHMAKTK